MKSCLGLALAVVLFNVQLVMAHSGGHGGPLLVAQCKKFNECTKDEISQAGLGVVARLVEMGKINSSWGLVKALNSIRKTNTEWLVTFKNSKESNKSNQILYVFISNEGYLSGANFSGF